MQQAHEVLERYARESQGGPEPIPSDTPAHFDEGSNGRRHWISDELQTPELQILLLNLVNGDSLITFSGNFLGSSFSGGFLSAQFLG